jgi:hypothetical protein
MPAQTITQVKGRQVVAYGAVTINNLSETGSISYDIGSNGTTVSAMKDIVHVLKDKGSIVSTITVSVPKGAPEIALLDAIIATQIPYPFLVRDDGIGETVAMASAICSQIALDDTTGDESAEMMQYSFMGNLTRAAL